MYSLDIVNKDDSVPAICFNDPDDPEHAVVVFRGTSGKDEWIDNADEPTHDDLCVREQLFLYNAIVEDKDLSQHINDAISSLAVALAADESARTGKTVEL